MKTAFFTFIILLSFNTQASVFCHTPRMNKVFEVADQKITFFNEYDNTARRELASLNSRNKPSPQGLTKIVDFENQKHTIHIGSLENFSDVEDYIIIKSNDGHEVTYPLTCEKK
jgi:hypothetical protein